MELDIEPTVFEGEQENIYSLLREKAFPKTSFIYLCLVTKSSC